MINVTNASIGWTRPACMATLSLLAWQLGELVADANPTGGAVAQGAAAFSSAGSQFTVNQTSANALINWQSFNIASGETTTFNQPSSSSVVWNQINGSSPSQILGTLNANGYVILQNQAGFYVGGNAAISAHGLVMTTSPTPAPTLSGGGSWDFDTPPVGSDIINYGKINIGGGGSAYLIADNIQNYGTIMADQGKIGLYDGQQVMLSTSPDGRGINAQVTLPQGSVDNRGNLIADGGTIAALAQTVNNNGMVQANSVQNNNGVIELVASDSVSLGANSVISAQGAATGVSSGGSVTVKSDNTFSDQAGSTINVAGGAQGGNGGQVEISAPQMTSVQSAIQGQATTGYAGGSLTIDPANVWLASATTDPTAPAGYTVIDVKNYSGLLIDISADNDIALNTLWTLTGASAPGTVSLSAGNSITFNDQSGIRAGNNWNVSLTAGTAFAPTAAQPTPTSGSDGIYLNGSAYIQTQNGNINLSAANEVQVTAGSNQRDAAGFSGVRTLAGGNITVDAVHGNVNSGINPMGYNYESTAPYYTVAVSSGAALGGISTAGGGNVAINAGGNVYSYLPSGNTSVAAEDGGSGAFGSEPGNVTITAGGSVFGHYVLANGIGNITVGQNVGALVGDPFALSLIDGTWNVNAPNGSIYLQEVRNPNGVFNNKGFSDSPGHDLFNYSPESAVNLTAGIGVDLTDQSVPRPFEPVPVIYPPTLTIDAGSGGVMLGDTVILFPSPDGNLAITTTDGGSLTASTVGFTTPPELLMSDSSQTRWVGAGIFGDQDHGSTLPAELNNAEPVVVNISGNMENITLITTKETQITVGGNMINANFSGQNLHAGDITSVIVDGQIYYTSAYAFVSLSAAIPTLPITDVPPAVPDTWDVIFSLLVNPQVLSTVQVPAGTLPSVLTSYLPAGAYYFPYFSGNRSTSNPGFVYNATTGQFGFGGPMSQSTLSALTQPLTVLEYGPNGYPVVDSSGHFVTETVSWVGASQVTQLFAASQGDPLPGNGQPGLRLGGPGLFDVTAGSISLGNAYGILSLGVEDPQGGFGRYANLASLTPSGATLDVTVTADQTGTEVVDGTTILPHASLDMLTSTIAALGGGDLNVTSTGGSMDLGTTELFNESRQVGFGVYTSGGGDVNVIADNDIDIDGSRIATYNGGNIFIESLAGNVDVGTGGDTYTGVGFSYVNPSTTQAGLYTEFVYGSGIVANTLVPSTAAEGYPPSDVKVAKVPGNITVETPQGDITASLGGITQESLGTATPIGPTITLEAGTAGGHTGNIDLGESGVIGGTVIATANGNISGLIISRQNSTVQAVGNFSGSVLAGGSANVSGTTVSGVIVGVGGVSVSGTLSGAEVLGQNVSVNGASSQSTLGSTAAATSTSGAAAQQANANTQQEVASNDSQDDPSKKKKSQALLQRVKRVTVILPPKA
ncbi:MAG: filamentous hemagglutinin N-terminal domain-containing protein [Verrucomicrobiota bacterium]|jgi:filamentous hemagglutinin family protein